MQGGQSFVVVLNQPLEEQFNQASFCAKFNETSWVRLTRVDYSTLKGRAVPGKRTYNDMPFYWVIILDVLN